MAPGCAAGRRRLLYTAAALSGVAGMMCCTAPSLWLYILFRGLTGAAVGGLGLSAFALGTESCGPSWRALAGMLLQVGLGFRVCPSGLGLLGLVCGSACELQAVMSCPMWVLPQPD
jgi:MFS family permease